LKDSETRAETDRLLPDFAAAQSGLLLLCREDISMIQRSVLISAAALLAPVLCATAALAAMGPCQPARFDFLCGSGDGAARAIAKTGSPSDRVAFAWRLTDRPPTSPPEQNDPNLENLVVRIEDGTILAKSHGAYWDLGSEIAKAYLMTAWSPDSRLLVKAEHRVESVSAELFAFGENDAAAGPLDLGTVIERAVLAKMQGTEQIDNSVLVFAAQPAMTIDDHGLMHAVVAIKVQDTTQGRYDVAVQVTHVASSIDAKVVSVTPYDGVSISILVH
jgi:hypothetical protein